MGNDSGKQARDEQEEPPPDEYEPPQDQQEPQADNNSGGEEPFYKHRHPNIAQNVRDWKKLNPDWLEKNTQKERKEYPWVAFAKWIIQQWCSCCCGCCCCCLDMDCLCCCCNGLMITSTLREGWYFPFCFHGHVAMRVKIRTMKGIRGGLCEDYLLAMLFPCFSYNQIKEELDRNDIIRCCQKVKNKVVDKQPNRKKPFEPGDEVNEWKRPLISCSDCEDARTCCGPDCFWPCCLGQNVAYRLDECCCVPYFGGNLSMRVKVRTMYAIKGSLCGDCLKAMFCPVCSNRQIYWELQPTEQA